MARLTAAVGLVIAFAASGAQAIQSTFDSSLEGWTTDNTGPLTHEDSDGNPGGHLQLDNDEGGIAHLFAPGAFLGDLSAFEGMLLSFDGKLVSGGGSLYVAADDYGLVRISGGGTSAQVDLLPSGTTPPLDSWANYAIPLTAAAFGVSQPTWSTILANVTEVRLTVEGLFGAEVQGIDNFCIGACGSSGTTTTTTPSSTTTSTVGSSTSSTSSTTSSTAIGSTTSTTLATDCELLDGTKLLLKAKAENKRGVQLLSKDGDVTIGAGNGSEDDPVLHGGSLRIVATGGDGFDDTYPLPADRWKYVKREGADLGYKLRRTSPIKGVLVQPGKRLRLFGAGRGFGHTLGTEPEAVDVVLTLGAHCYCLRFGGEHTFKTGKKWLAENAPQSPGCPPPASPNGAFVD